MADCADLNGRTPSPALSGTSELTVLSRSPSPVPNYRCSTGQYETTLLLTPPNTPMRSRAAYGRFNPCKTKRIGSPDAFISPKSLRGPRERDSPSSLTNPRRPHTPWDLSKYFENAASSDLRPFSSNAAPWFAGKGGCGTLEVLPKEIRQKIYSLAFDLNEPVTIKQCCGLHTTVRERGACKKHGSRTASGGGRFNVLQVSKAMKSEASWVLLNQATLLLEANRALTQYLGCYRWNGKRHSSTVQVEVDRKATMWASVGQFRHVKIRASASSMLTSDPTVYTNSLVEVAFSLCQSWVQASPWSANSCSRHTVQFDLGDFFQYVVPFNVGGVNEAAVCLMWVNRYGLLSRNEPDFKRMAAESGHNLLRLVAVVAKYHGQLEWKFVANTQLDDNEDGGGLEWLHTFQVECAKHGLPLEDGNYDSE